MNNKIAIVLGTRNRPNNIHRFTDSIYKTAQNPKLIETIFYVDNDDVQSQDTLDEIGTFHENVRYIVGPKISLNQISNEGYKQTEADIIGYFGDDFIFHTNCWDRRIKEEFEKIPDKIGLIWGNDLYNKVTATHGFIHRNWIESLGYVTPKQYDGDYGDTYLTDLANKIDRSIYMSDVVFEHKHWSVKDEYGKPKAENDITYQEKNQRGYGGSIPCQIQYANDEGLRVQEAQKLLTFIENFKATENFQ